MVRGSRAVGVSWDMGMAQGLRVGVWEGSEMVYCTTAASHLNVSAPEQVLAQTGVLTPGPDQVLVHQVLAHQIRC